MIVGKHKIKYIVFIIIFFVVLSILWFLKKSHIKSTIKNSSQNYEDKINTNNNDNKNAEIYVQAFSVQKVDFKDELKDLVGTVKGSSLEVKSSQEETLIKINFKPGDKLKKGTIIAELDHTRTKAKLDQSKIEYYKKKMLFNVGGISKNELDQTASALKIAQKDYDDTFIIAPKNGYMGEIIAQEGEFITRQMPIAIFVSSDDNFFIETSVIENNFPLIKENQKVDIKLDIFPEEIIEGKILNISPEATTSSRMIPLRIELPKKLNIKLKPGFSAISTIIVFSKKTIVIPQICLVKGNPQVYIVDSQKKAHLRDIEIDYKSKNFVEVIKGLNENDIIVSNPEYANVQEGSILKFSEPEKYKIEEEKQNK
jgi:RND family efflux transporter MFP subunit